ncbi:MAG: Gfo/Idh/MocA family oxidoreductase [Oscillospiraceae bacterium]|nr:Gfo/Idh/MocA family oxidoreductase [Oscillospiraceae bacterium]
MNKISIGCVGLGGRGMGLLRDCLLPRGDVIIAGLCDMYEDRCDAAKQMVKQAGHPGPAVTDDYRKLLDMPGLDALMVTSAWESHIEIACAAMRAGKYVAVEVGGAYSIDDCWRLVRTHEETGAQCMLLENCCYGRNELMIQNMARQGVFGEIVHCQGGYHHNLRKQIAYGLENRHYRYRNYLSRNCENYPTHELGPIAQLLMINRGNRMLMLNSIASKASGMRAFIRGEREEGGGNGGSAGGSAGDLNFAQGDVVTTIIKCAGGETIALTLDTTLPRAYSRGYQVHGTKGMFMEDNMSIFIDKKDNEYDFEWHKRWGNVEEYRQQYEHPVWQEYLRGDIKGGHEGIDWLVISDFIDAVKASAAVPINVYDMAAWMSISCLSEDSIAMGGAPVPIPDFTNGKWIGGYA